MIGGRYMIAPMTKQNPVQKDNVKGYIRMKNNVANISVILWEQPIIENIFPKRRNEIIKYI